MRADAGRAAGAAGSRARGCSFVPVRPLEYSGDSPPTLYSSPLPDFDSSSSAFDVLIMIIKYSSRVTR